MTRKTPNDVRGSKILCVNFEMCPICYGCRNYNDLDPECQICKKDKKNLCNTNIHKASVVNKMISKNKFTFTEDIKFKSK